MTTKRKIRVLQLIYGLKTGGAERVVVNYAKFLNRDDFEVTVCSLTSDNHYDAELRELGIECFLLGKRKGVDLRVPFRLFRLMRSRKIDIVHFHDAPCSNWATIPALLTGVAAIVRTLHNVTDGERVQSRLQSMATRFMYRYHTRFLAVSSEVLESQSKKYPFIADRITTLHNGIDPVAFDAGAGAERRPGALAHDDNAVLVGVVARLAPQKAHEVFLQAMRLLLDRQCNVRAMIVGDGPRMQELVDLSARLELGDRVEFTGVRGDIPQLLSTFDIFSLSSDWEGFPMTILEAMASGKPVVVTDVGGNREAVVDGDTGLLVPPQDPKALADALSRLVADPALREGMGRAGRERFMGHFTADAMARATEAIYRQYLPPR